MSNIELSDFTVNLLSSVNGQNKDTIDDILIKIVDFCKPEICSLWEIDKDTNDNCAYVSLKKRISASDYTTDIESDFVHKINENCLTHDIIAMGSKGISFLQSQDIDISKHISFDRLSELSIKQYVAIPIHGLEPTDVIAILFLYSKDIHYGFPNSLALIIDSVVSIALTNSSISNKLCLMDDLVNNYNIQGRELDIKRLFQPIVDSIIKKYIPCEGISFFLLDNDYTSWYRLIASTPIIGVNPENYQEHFYEINDGLTGRCAAEGKPLICIDIPNSNHLGNIHGKVKNKTKHPGKTMLVMPILRPTDKSVIGMIRLVNKIHRENLNIINYFTDSDIELMDFACHYIALVIDTYLGAEQTNMRTLKLAHEFKSPASSICGISDRAYKHLKDPAFVDTYLSSYLLQIKQSSENLIYLVEDSLFSYHKQRDDNHRTLSNCDLRKLIQKSKASVISFARQEGLRFDSIIISDVPRILINVEEDKFVSIFRNNSSLKI